MLSAKLQGLFLSSFFPGRNMKKVQAFIAGVFEGGIRVLWFAHCYNILPSY
jgi:hypothetical protein